jgi:hypothetical protein
MVATILSFLTLLSEQAVLPLLASKSSDTLVFLGIKVVDWPEFTSMMVRFVLNLLVALVIIRGIYYAKAKRKDYLFTYLLINIIIFILCYTLSSVKLQLGFALGLFAIFGIIRYRTDAIPIKEMTYLFVIIGLAVINALSNKKVSYAELLFANGVIITVTYILEYLWLLRHESCKRVLYERIDLIHPDKRQELIADLEARIGVKVSRIEIGQIDFMRDVAKINVHYYEDDVNSADSDSSSDDGDD